MTRLLRKVLVGTVLMLLAAAYLPVQNQAAGNGQGNSGQPIRVGIIGTDTSHVIEFTRIFNDASDPSMCPASRSWPLTRAAARTGIEHHEGG